MFVRGLFRLIRHTATTRQCLRILQLSTPITKKQIKSRYLAMAKKYHPDSVELKQKEPDTSVKSKQKIQQISKMKAQLQQKFVNVNKAYQYLKQLSEEQINSNQDKPTSRAPEDSAGERRREDRRKMTTQQIKRQQTYQYFNQKYKEQFAKFTAETNSQPQQRPLYKLVPELFVGFLLLAVMLGDWSYRIMKRDQAQKQKGNRQDLVEESRPSNPFRSMNHKVIFNRRQQNNQLQE